MAFKDDFIKHWVEERDMALLTMDVDIFRRFYEKYMVLGVYNIELPDDSTVVKAAMCQGILGLAHPPKDKAEEAKKWLRDHGMSDDPWKE